MVQFFTSESYHQIQLLAHLYIAVKSRLAPIKENLLTTPKSELQAAVTAS